MNTFIRKIEEFEKEYNKRKLWNSKFKKWQKAVVWILFSIGLLLSIFATIGLLLNNDTIENIAIGAMIIASISLWCGATLNDKFRMQVYNKYYKHIFGTDDIPNDDVILNHFFDKFCKGNGIYLPIDSIEYEYKAHSEKKERRTNSPKLINFAVVFVTTVSVLINIIPIKEIIKEHTQTDIELILTTIRGIGYLILFFVTLAACNKAYRVIYNSKFEKSDRILDMLSYRRMKKKNDENKPS